MILAALVDAGLDADELRSALKRLPVEGYHLSAEKACEKALAATRVRVDLDKDARQPPRHLSDIRDIIEKAKLSDTVTARAIAVFERLANAEARVHGCSVEQVHFHEVGGVDAIVDIVGACWGLERLGIEGVVCSPVPLGSGTVTCEHGVLPVPAPATALLLKGVPIADCGEPGELTTPTGAALLTEFAQSYGPLPAMRIERIGMGVGSRPGRGRPNILRVLIGSQAPLAQTDRIVVLEANIDDATGEVLGHTLDRLLAAGALDAYCLPIHMKKSRPGLLLTVLTEVERVAELEEVIFTETTTFGIRRHEAVRSKLERTIQNVETRYGPIRIKVGARSGQVITAAPEYDDCRQAARQHEAPLRQVMAEAMASWRTQRTPGVS